MNKIQAAWTFGNYYLINLVPDHKNTHFLQTKKG